MAFVMGISSAQAILRNVRDDFIVISGVYAIVDSPPSVCFTKPLLQKIEGGWGGGIVRRGVQMHPYYATAPKEINWAEI